MKTTAENVSKNTLNTKIVIGKVLKPHGLGGEMRILPFTDDFNNFRNYKTFFIKDQSYAVTYFKSSGKYLIVKLAGIESVDEVRALQGEFLTIARSDALKKQTSNPINNNKNNNNNSILIADLINLEVYTNLTIDKNQTQSINVGVIEGYYDVGVKGILRIDLAPEMFPFLVFNKKQVKNFYMPCDDEYLGEIELDKKRVWIKNLEKLVELKTHLTKTT